MGILFGDWDNGQSIVSDEPTSLRYSTSEPYITKGDIITDPDMEAQYYIKEVHDDYFLCEMISIYPEEMGDFTWLIGRPYLKVCSTYE
jgi:hypothetical protein